MDGADILESLSIFLRAFEGLGLLALVGVFLALSTCMKRNAAPRAVQTITRVSRRHRRAV